MSKRRSRSYTAVAAHPGGPHELGQNLLVDGATIDTITRLTGQAPDPIVELCPGSGAVTVPLGEAGRPITAVELDSRHADRLEQRTPDNVRVVRDDVLRFRFPRHPHTLVGNLPFHLTTPILRRVLAAEHWRTAVLLVQWEVARRRAGVGGASMLTASWWPWYEFELHARVPARSFRPVPSVDAGLITIHRRPSPLVTEREAYQRFVKRVFTGPGRGLLRILVRTGQLNGAGAAHRLRDRELPTDALPKDLTAEQWARLWRLCSEPARKNRRSRD
ncbi:23S rRNA (adenine-N6)-dimethyltransferase [Actinopolyspora biskrensis]|uniref:23S rRNA (Adenine-N6)-dimethyltransferase n=1 Tax=Actinopolyspora biskrensis TaxID=1470178 RepID=A0A852YZL7_9ACTN|nr:23S ribosomal RNA methyltransferase Erm [Actinopolyspora biskrensis]NYH80494.1 23S rRNA (adenine-N6)-dimethyltransferase [Actinopolyspora biskrensis]